MGAVHPTMTGRRAGVAAVLVLLAGCGGLVADAGDRTGPAGGVLPGSATPVTERREVGERAASFVSGI